MPEPETNESSANPEFSPADDQHAADGASATAAKDETPETALAAAKAEAAQNLDRYMRAAADMENFRRRTVREKDELRTIATGRVLEDIFPVLDNLALALAAAKQPAADVKSLVGGVDMVHAQLKAALAAHGLKEINPIGQPFDPHQHEAISHQPSDEVEAEQVMNVVRLGYSLNGRLLRPASVVVSSGPKKETKR